MTPGLHPCDIGDLEEWVQYSPVAHLIPLGQGTLVKHWRERYAAFVEKRKLGGLWVNVRRCDEYLDARGKRLLSEELLKEKRKRNPGWHPAGECFVALASTDETILQKLAELVAQRLDKLTPAPGGVS